MLDGHPGLCILRETAPIIQNTEYFTPPINTDHKGLKLTLNLENSAEGKDTIR